MSASPQPTQSAKRPLEEASSPSRATDQPDAKRPALDKVVKPDEDIELAPQPGENGETPSEQPAADKSNGVNADEQAPTAASDDTLEGKQADSAVEPGQAGVPANANDETAWIHIRAVISSPEAATIIGKGGENVSNIRKLSGAKCTVSDYQKGAVERILTVSGVVDAAAKVGLPIPLFLVGAASLSAWLLTLRPGVRTHHPHSEQRAPGGALVVHVQDLPASAVDPPHPDRLHHREGRRSYPRDPGSLGRAAQCVRLLSSPVVRALACCHGRSRRCPHR